VDLGNSFRLLSDSWLRSLGFQV